MRSFAEASNADACEQRCAKLEAENMHLKEVITSAFDDLQCNDDSGAYLILKAAIDRMNTTKGVT